MKFSTFQVWKKIISRGSDRDPPPSSRPGSSLLMKDFVTSLTCCTCHSVPTALTTWSLQSANFDIYLILEVERENIQSHALHRKVDTYVFQCRKFVYGQHFLVINTLDHCWRNLCIVMQDEKKYKKKINCWWFRFRWKLFHYAPTGKLTEEKLR